MTNGRNNRSRILIYSASNGTHGNPTARTATDNGGFYIDCEVDGEQRRVRVKSPGSGGGASNAVYGTLRANAWENSQQRLSVDGLTANQNGVIGVTHDITDEQLLACGNGGLYVCEQGEGYLMIALSGDTPPCDIPVVVILLD